MSIWNGLRGLAALGGSGEDPMDTSERARMAPGLERGRAREADWNADASALRGNSRGRIRDGSRGPGRAGTSDQRS